ncbi:MAG: NHL repeat-containing protein [Bacteroidota bacterium]
MAFITTLVLGAGYHAYCQNNESWLRIDNIFREAISSSVTPSGLIYVLDKGTDEVIKLSPEGKIVSRVGGFGWAETAFDLPADIYSPNDIRTYVADYGNHRIVYLDGNLNFLSFLQLHEGDDLTNRFGYPKSAATDRFGSLYIVDGENTRIVKMGALNTIDLTFGGVDGGKGRLSAPGRVRVTPDDIVYVRDGDNIMIYDIYGNFINKVPFPDNYKFRTYTVYQSSLFILDSLGVRGITANCDTSMAMEAATTAIDVAVTSDKIYFLTRTGIIIQPFDTAWIR